MILVTGGAGYIGSHTVRQLSESGYEALVFDSMELGHPESVGGAEIVKGDLRNPGDIRAAFEGRKIDAVVHFAGYSAVGDSMISPDAYFHNNITGGLNLLDAMKSNGVDKIIFSSSAATYGEPLRTPIDETHPQLPTSAYGETKLAFERVLKWYGAAFGIRSISLRYFNACGAHPKGDMGEDHRNEQHLIPLVLQTALGKRRNIKIFGTDWDTPDGACIRDYVHVVDLSNAHLLALKALEDGAETTAYNLGNGAGHSVRQVIETAEAVVGREIPKVEASRRPGDPARLVASSERLRRELGWIPKYPELETIIEHAWKWHSSHPNGYGR